MVETEEEEETVVNCDDATITVLESFDSYEYEGGDGALEVNLKD